MKIAIVHLRHAYTGGVELYLNKLAEHMALKGDEVTIICRSHDSVPPHPSVKFVKLKSLSIGKSHRLWRFAKDVEKHVASSDYDLVYGLAHAWTHDVLRIGAGTSYHQSKALKRKMRLKDIINNIIERKAMSEGAYLHVICNSRKSANEIQVTHNVPKEKISVIHNFVDTNIFDRARVQKESLEMRMKLGIDDDLPLFLFLGTGYERKGLKQALEAFSLLEFDARLLIVGRDSREQEYKDFAEKLGVAERCIFFGESKQPELFFTMADCYVLPTHYEPFGFTAIEALSCGIPVITTENCGAKEVLDSQVSTVIGGQVDPLELSQAMSKWRPHFNSDLLRGKCRAVAMKQDSKVVLEANYQKLMELYELKCAQESITAS